MNLYKLTRLKDLNWEDTGQIKDITLYADNEEQARDKAANNCGDEGAEPWKSHEQTKCEIIDSTGAPSPHVSVPLMGQKSEKEEWRAAKHTIQKMIDNSEGGHQEDFLRASGSPPLGRFLRRLFKWGLAVAIGYYVARNFF